MISALQGKPNVKKISKVYNEAYVQISKLWYLLPESAKDYLRSEDQLEEEEEDMEDVSLNDKSRGKFKNVEERRNSLKGQIASYKEKLVKKKLKKKLTKQIRKQLIASKKKERLENKLLKRKENDKKIERKTEKMIKVMPEVSENLDDVVENKPKKSKKLKVKFIDDPMEVDGDDSGQLQSQDSVKENKSGLSNKKIRILKKQEMKSEKKKEKKKIMKQKLREEAKAKAELMIENEVKPQVLDQPTDEENTIMFNKIDDIEEIHKKKFKKDKKIKGVEKDPKKALTKLVELNKRICDLKVSGQEEKAAAIESKHSWNKAILKADGVKVKDNVELLKKSIRKKEKKKGKSKEEWQKRTNFKEKKMADAQKKRKDNILKKKKERKQKKIKKSIKKGRVVL